MHTDDIEHRFRFHAATTEELRTKHENVRSSCRTLAHFINGLMPDGREKSLAITALEECMMWANAGVARGQNVT